MLCAQWGSRRSIPDGRGTSGGRQAAGDGVLVAKERRSAVDDVDSTTGVAAKCDGKSLVHINMRPERRQPTQIGSPIKISRGQEQGPLR
jgi:hypothetical protein